LLWEAVAVIIKAYSNPIMLCNLTKQIDPRTKKGKNNSLPNLFTSPDKKFQLFQGDSLELLKCFKDESIDLVFADPPYFLSNNGITCHAGKMVSVNKGRWDVSMGFKDNYSFVRSWLSECQRLLSANGSIWVSGTSHIIHIVGSVMMELGFKILNDITWVKPNPPPNLSCRYFTHATETIIWAGKNKKTKHVFNYACMKELNNNKQMKSVWEMKAPSKTEKKWGKHPTQKPLALLDRIILASTNPGDSILDPFSGSATTGISAWLNNRSYIGIEKVEEYNALAIKRFNDALANKTASA